MKIHEYNKMREVNNSVWPKCQFSHYEYWYNCQGVNYREYMFGHRYLIWLYYQYIKKPLMYYRSARGVRK